MKRTVCLLLCLTLFATFFSGCSKKEEQVSIPQPTEPPIPQYIYDLAESYPEAPPEQLPDKVFADTEVYTLYREDGICYLSFKSGNYKIHYVLDDKESPPYISKVFNSTEEENQCLMEEKYQWLCSPVITEDVEQQIRNTFPLDEEKGFIFPDPEQLYILQLPEEYELIQTDLHDYYAYKSQNRRRDGCAMTLITKESFISALANYHRFEYQEFPFDVTRTDEEDGTTIYEYESLGYKIRTVLYTMQTENRTLFIEKEYIDSIESPNVYGYHFSEVKIFGYDNGKYFRLGVFYSDPEPLLELVDKVTIVKYQP